jgi:hypothetical protein
MADLNDPVETGMPRSVKFGIAAVLILIVFAWALPKKAGNNNNGAAGAGTAGGDDAMSVSDRETERQLTGILKGLSPEFVVISTERVDSVAELGQWAGEAFSKGDAAAVKIDKEANSKWFSGDALKEVNDATFSLRDGHHLTMAMLAGETVTRLAQKTTDPLEQIDELFQIVVRETTLMPDDHDTQLPGTPFESLLIGRATASSRAWAFGILLRQLQLDAVVLEPKSKPEAWLIGAITPSGDVLLYDPRLGTGLPSGAGPDGFKKVAGLALIKEKPELLRLLDVENGDSYPLKAEDLASLNVKLITDSSASSERMAKLQTLLSGSLMEVFDGVGKNPLREPALAERVITAGSKGSAWTAADVSVWSYPEQQSEAFMSKGAEDSPAWRGVSAVFAGPVTLTTVRKQTKGEQDSGTEMAVQRSKEPLRLIRVLQLEGNFAQALKGYLPVRTAPRGMVRSRDPEMQAKLEEAMPLNYKAADFATFWTAACQSQLNPKLAPQTLQQYLRDYPQGEFGPPTVVELWASSLVLAGQQVDAVKLLEGGRRTPRLEVLLKQWKNVPAPESKPAAETPPTDPKPPEKPPESSDTVPMPKETPAAADQPPPPPEAT